MIPGKWIHPPSWFLRLVTAGLDTQGIDDRLPQEKEAPVASMEEGSRPHPHHSRRVPKPARILARW